MNSDIDNPEGLELSQIDIHELLPQQEPFVMIDRLVYCDKTVTLAETEIRNDHIFVENGHLTASGLIENIAQTCAARIGYYNYIHKKGIQIGFIGAIRNMDIRTASTCGRIAHHPCRSERRSLRNDLSRGNRFLEKSGLRND